MPVKLTSDTVAVLVFEFPLPGNNLLLNLDPIRAFGRNVLRFDPSTTR